MAIFDYNGKKIFYTVEGKGKPILLLNGIMMTTVSWEPVADVLRENNTLIRLDLLDQGQSQKMTEDYSIEDQADVVAALIKHLNLGPVSVVGISYGGYTGLNLATKYHGKGLVDRLILFNTAADVNFRDGELFKLFMQTAKNDDAYVFYLTTIPIFYSPTWYETRTDWMKEREDLLVGLFSQKPYRDTVYRLAKSCMTHNVLNKLDKIDCPVVVISGEEDYLLPFPRQKAIYDGVKDGHLLIMSRTGHVSTYESPYIFTSLILGFVNNPKTKFEI